jgi:hypothetical protein
VKKSVLVYGLLGGALIAALKLIEYRALVLEHSVGIYGARIALVFSGLGIWLGLKLTRVREVPVFREIQVEVPTPHGCSTSSRRGGGRRPCGGRRSTD